MIGVVFTGEGLFVVSLAVEDVCFFAVVGLVFLAAVEDFRFDDADLGGLGLGVGLFRFVGEGAFESAILFVFSVAEALIAIFVATKRAGLGTFFFFKLLGGSDLEVSCGLLPQLDGVF